MRCILALRPPTGGGALRHGRAHASSLSSPASVAAVTERTSGNLSASSVKCDHKYRVPGSARDRSHYVDRAGLKLLASSSPPAATSQQHWNDSNAHESGSDARRRGSEGYRVSTWVLSVFLRPWKPVI
eukprot:XP_011538744.1 uncharacterized protein LOC644215 [Homo sapiens]